MPRLSVFPKCYMDALCLTRTMTLFDWIDLAATLGVDGVEMYPGFFESFEPSYLERVRAHLERAGLEAPMMCASPDFTQPGADARRTEVEREKQMIAVTAALGGRYCRVLSGQRRDEVSRADGVRWTVEGTHRGELLGIRPTGKHVRFSGISIYRLAGRKIAEQWEQWDRLDLMRQLGVVPAPVQIHA